LFPGFGEKKENQHISFHQKSSNYYRLPLFVVVLGIRTEKLLVVVY